MEREGKDESERLKEEAIEAARLLFMRNKTSGSSANLSFLCNGQLYITCSGSCFGTLKKEDFSVISLEGRLILGKKPSKEWPAHMVMYRSREDVQAVIHTHGRNSVLWSFYEDLDTENCIPEHTPYLGMKVGKVGLAPYHPPGSRQLFEALETAAGRYHAKAYLLKQHGPIVGGSTIMDAFYNLEELEESCAVAWELKKLER